MTEYLKHIPLEFLFGAVALFGGVARYLNGYTNGTPFSLGMFIASTIVSGFSGYMFAYLGIALMLPTPMLFVMAGTGGFFGDQTMKLLLEYFGNKVSPNIPPRG